MHRSHFIPRQGTVELFLPWAVVDDATVNNTVHASFGVSASRSFGYATSKNVHGTTKPWLAFRWNGRLLSPPAPVILSPSAFGSLLPLFTKTPC